MHDIFIILFLVLALAPIIYFIIRSFKNRNRFRDIISKPFPQEWRDLLSSEVVFYKKLEPDEKNRFENRIKKFLAKTRITGVDVQLDDRLKLLVASSAIIPVFRFQNWEYAYLEEVLIYHGLINSYRIEEKEKVNILGQVRPFQAGNIVLLSKESLLRGFSHMNGNHNVGIHEFVHMIDRADGDTDGIPKLIFPKELIQPWTSLMKSEMSKIRKGRSVIDSYAATSDIEFLAVASEFFFTDPEELKKKKPELYEILAKVFRAK